MDQHTTDKRKAKKTMETNSSEAKRDVKNVKLNHSHSDQYGSSLFRYNWFFLHMCVVYSMCSASTAVHFVYLKMPMIVIVFAKRNKTENEIFRCSLQHMKYKNKLQNGEHE